MFKSLICFAACTVVSATAALGQFVESGSQTGSGSPLGLGQSGPLSNATTTFDGIDFRVQRIIRDPKDLSKLRIVAEILNSGQDDRWAYLFRPAPNLIDELGNVYVTEKVAGINACFRSLHSDWVDEVFRCGSKGGFIRLAPNVPVAVMIAFTPAGEDGYDSELAKLATFASASLNFVVSTNDTSVQSEDEFRASVNLHNVTVPQITVPAPE
ncbi:MAG: hypothetical protein O9274_15930 [Limnobacter sp.]|jgi:hypothetical protein|uniref:hypothetical protein n=1 Tax=Limnobacter sp. TaxID=2003368 RepID=UPI0022BABDEA|nr:hypothetical protein [Limnobacter sp.]MCZ8017193.1 hypothetical protein [Limnobacter sp.]MCZ8081326.1 hypothetical protein [Paracoccaceae bacterium]